MSMPQFGYRVLSEIPLFFSRMSAVFGKNFLNAHRYNTSSNYKKEQTGVKRHPAAFHIAPAFFTSK
jgi:hypothetical protein